MKIIHVVKALDVSCNSSHAYEKSRLEIEISVEELAEIIDAGEMSGNQSFINELTEILNSARNEA